jgi:hypothetical protein
MANVRLLNHDIELSSTVSLDTPADTDNDTDDSLSTLILRLAVSIVLPMWCAMILSSLFFVGVRQVLGGGELTRDMSVSVSSDNVFATTLAVPALFGPGLKTQTTVPLVLINHNACEKFTYSFPNLTSEMHDTLKQQFSAEQGDAGVNWAALVERGGCPFDEKVFRLEQAGFDIVIVYNSASKEDVPVRMSSHIRVLISNVRDTF